MKLGLPPLFINSTLTLAVISIAFFETACASQPTATEVPTSKPTKEKIMEESAKRRIPRVAPVAGNGILYEVLRGARSRGFTQNGGVIVAIDMASGKELWTMLVYTTLYDDKEEADVQDVYITELRLSGDVKSLYVKNEEHKQFIVKLSDRSITEKQ